MNNKIKLFQTAKKICERGDISLSASDKKRIEEETIELIRRSQSYKSASKDSMKFEKVLNDLRNSKDATDSFKIVARHLESEGVLNKDISEILNRVEDAVDEISNSIEEAEDLLNGEGEISNKKDKLDNKKDDKDDIKDNKKDDELDKNKNKDKDKPKDIEEDEVLDLPKSKDDILKMSQTLDETVLKNKLPPKKPSKGPSKGLLPKSLNEIELKDKKEENVNEVEMGMDLSKDVTNSMVAKTKVYITPDKNIVASHEDHGPLFMAVPFDNIKNNPTELKRAANKVLGLIIYDGFKTAAEKCGTTLIANIDDDITLDSEVDVEPNKNDVTDEDVTDTVEDRLGDPNSSLGENEVDTEDKPDEKVVANKNQKISRDTILDEAEDTDEIDQRFDPRDRGSIDHDETDTRKDRSSGPENVLVEGDTDIKSIEANFKKLYANRAKKSTSENIEKFIKRFTRCMHIASKRMHLNHDANPYKIAAVDVLTSDDVRFSDGYCFEPMDVRTAKELTELISSEGYNEFVDLLIDRTANLMDRSDEYLNDLENDIGKLAVVDLEVEEDNYFRTSSRSSELRRAAVEGNFDLNTSFSEPPKEDNSIKNAIGNTKVGRRTAELKNIIGSK